MYLASAAAGDNRHNSMKRTAASGTTPLAAVLISPIPFAADREWTTSIHSAIVWPRMISIGIRELRARLYGVLNSVKHWERITVTVRGRPIAIIGPAATKTDDRRIASMVRDGQAASRAEPVSLPISRGGRPLMRLLQIAAECVFSESISR